MASQESTYRVGSLFRQYQESGQGYCPDSQLDCQPSAVSAPSGVDENSLPAGWSASGETADSLCSVLIGTNVQLKNKRNALILKCHQIGSRVKMKLQTTANQLQQLIAKERKLGVSR